MGFFCSFGGKYLNPVLALLGWVSYFVFVSPCVRLSICTQNISKCITKLTSYLLGAFLLVQESDLILRKIALG